MVAQRNQHCQLVKTRPMRQARAVATQNRSKQKSKAPPGRLIRQCPPGASLDARLYPQTGRQAPAAPEAERAAAAEGPRLREGLHRSHGQHPLDQGPRLARRRACAPARRSSSIRPPPSFTTRRRSSRACKAYNRQRRQHRAVPAPTRTPSASAPSAVRMALAGTAGADLHRRRSSELVKIDRAWIPSEGQPLSAPFVIATEAFLGVGPRSEYLFLRHRLTGQLVLQGRRRA